MATIVLSGQGTGFRLKTNPSQSDETPVSQVVMVSRSGTRKVTVKNATEVRHAA